jgi:hypothetical protein
VSPVKDVLWKIDHCYFCGGKNAECKHCGGSNKIPMHQCPRAEALVGGRGNPSMLLPFFYEYFDRGVWPDGRGRLFQPVKLVEAFEILNSRFQKYKK